MQIMAKNPFEIRAEMVALAKEYLDQVTALNIEAANKMLEANQITADQLKEMYKMYSMNDLMEKAKEMYNFVSTKE
jgi:hypothetical protein